MLSNFLIGGTLLADEISGNLGNSMESGLTGVVKNCSPLSVQNGFVEVYPSCLIKCNNGYYLSTYSCVQNSNNNGGGNSGSPIANININNTPSTSLITVKKDDPIIPINLSSSSSPVISLENKDAILEKILTESQVINSKKTDVILEAVNSEADLSKEKEISIKYKEILTLDQKLLLLDKKTVNDFITYGTKSTQRLGSGERAAVINSYYKAYKKIADSEEEWSDILKIASGRWPKERSSLIEYQASLEFKKVYGRTSNMKNNIDENAIMVMAYGLLPINRNLSSEKSAIKSFEFVYRHKPINALAWNIVRAIAYSGAKR